MALPSDAGLPGPAAGAGPPLGEGILRGGVHELLGISVLEMTVDRVVLSLEVTPKVHQPMGLLHGGISALLAESAASIGASLSAPPGSLTVGVELNASHLRPMSEGVLTATATPIRKGRTMQVWSISLVDDLGRDICAARCSVAVRPGSDQGPS